jgi:hypothetical protein
MSVAYNQFVVVSWKMRNKFYDWCTKNNIECTYEGTYEGHLDFEMDAWLIKDEKHRVWATLKWA